MIGQNGNAGAVPQERLGEVRVFEPKSKPVSAQDNWPAEMNAAAFHGPLGRFVKSVDDHTESDRVATLMQAMVACGNAAGRGPHFTVEASRHGVNLNIVLVGKSSKARKGTSWDRAAQVVGEADNDWRQCIASGLSSGEGLIHHVRDPVTKQEPIKEKGRIVGYQEETIDHGVEDKRLQIVEAEFASVLKQCERSGNTLSMVVRNAWDHGNLKTMTRSNPLKATAAHISIIGHVTDEEVTRYLDTTEAANGFANRFMWFCVKRSKILPEGGSLQAHELAPVIEELRDALIHARAVGEITRDAEATKLWHAVYGELSEGKPGLLGAMTARAEAQVMRMACLYAVLDREHQIRPVHLRAALAVWEYCEASVRYVFGERLGDPDADRVCEALANNPDGMTRTEISSLFGRNLPAHKIDRALVYLKAHGRAQDNREAPPNGTGRPAERWTAI